MTVLRREGTLSRTARREGWASLRIVVPRLLGAVLVPSTRNRLLRLVRFFRCKRGPEEANELSSHRHDDLVVRLASLGQAAPALPGGGSLYGTPLIGRATKNAA